MRIDSLGWSNVDVLDRICKAYGFSQKIQLANHFDIASSSLSNRYTRGAISYDFAAHCALETGANLRWLLTGEGQCFADKQPKASEINSTLRIDKFTLSEGSMILAGDFFIDRAIAERLHSDIFCLVAESAYYIVERIPAITDGHKIVDIDGTVSLRDVQILPGRKLRVHGGIEPFECAMDDISILGSINFAFVEMG